MQIGQGYYESLRWNGRVIRGWLEATADVYLQAMVEKSPFSIDLERLFQAGMRADEVRLQDRLIESRGIRIPSIVRADMMDGDKVCEVQIFGQGWEHMHAISQVMLGDDANFGIGLDYGFLKAMQDLTGREKPGILYLNSHRPTYSGSSYFLGEVARLGGRTYLTHHKYPIPNLEGYDVVASPMGYPLRAFNDFEGASRMWKAYRDGKIQMEPPPIQLFRSKFAMALPFHPNTSELYSDAVRDLFPPTIIVDPMISPGLPEMIASEDGTFTLDWERVTPWDRVCELPASRRRLVLKYGGAYSQKGEGGGSKGVFDLEGGRKGVKEHMDNALSDAENDAPWVVQMKIDSDYQVPRWEDGHLQYDRMHMRLTPVYWLPIAGGAEIMGGSALFRRDWKVHGQPDSVNHAIQVVD